MNKNSINRDELYEIVLKFRNAIDDILDLGGFYPNFLLNSFPSGCCDITSDFLHKYLLDNFDISTKQVSGYCKVIDCRHCWLQTEDGIIIDITGNQYVKLNLSKCYVDKANKIYESFKDLEYYYYNRDIFDDNGLLVKSRFEMKKIMAYKMIVDKINDNYK